MSGASCTRSVIFHRGCKTAKRTDVRFRRSDQFEFGERLCGVEQLIGSGFGDVLTGDGFDNILTGGGGADQLTGGAGIDTLDGGAGNDTYIVDNTGDTVRIEFTLPQALGDLPGWPHDVQLKLVVELGERLALSLTSRNMGNTPVTLSQALHSYFAVSDVRQARVEGVEGLGYIETLADWEQRQQQGPLGFAGETDRIYLATPQTLSIVDPHWQRRITLTSSGSRSAVIWNPWTERARELPDMADDGWQRMLCIETANVWDDVVELRPGATCSLSVSIGSEVI